MDITQRIADIIKTHDCPHCNEWNRSTSHATHAAQVITAELGLYEEWTWSWRIPADGERQFGCIVDTREQAIAEGEPYMDPTVRYVTEWNIT